MRDKGRIRPFLDELGKIWEESPDMRFGQLLVNMGFGGSPGGGRDPWFAEEDEWREAFKRWEAQCSPVRKTKHHEPRTNKTGTNGD